MEFATTRRGVEAFVEPPTTVNPPSMLLVAHDGEWTRRNAPSIDDIWQLARKLNIACYDVNLSGYPSSMREYNARQKEAREQQNSRDSER